MVRFAALCLLMAVCLQAESVRAQSDAEVAAAVVERAQEAYDQGDFQRAVVLLEESLQFYEAPATHYNLARTLSEVSRWEEARTHFQRFLELTPDAPQRAAVESRIAELDRRIARDAASQSVVQEAPVIAEAPEEPPTQTQVVYRPPPPRNTAPWVVAGGGVLIAAIAIPMGSASTAAQDRAAEAATHREGADELVTARRFARVANGLLITGSIVAVAGIIWAIAKPRRSESAVRFDGTAVHIRF